MGAFSKENEVKKDVKKAVLIITGITVIFLFLVFVFVGSRVHKNDKTSLDQTLTFEFNSNNFGGSSYIPNYPIGSNEISGGIGYVVNSILGYEFYFRFDIESKDGTAIFEGDGATLINKEDYNVKCSLWYVAYVNGGFEEGLLLDNLEFTGVFAIVALPYLPDVPEQPTIPSENRYIFISVEGEGITEPLKIYTDFDVEFFVVLFGNSWDVLSYTRPKIFEGDGYQFGDILEAFQSAFIDYPVWILKHLSLPIDLLGGIL